MVWVGYRDANRTFKYNLTLVLSMVLFGYTLVKVDDQTEPKIEPEPGCT